MKWKIEYPNGTIEYHSPTDVQLIMGECELKNHKKVAEKIYDGGVKVVCAWVLCDTIEVKTTDFIQYDPLLIRIRYNPRITPNWVLDGIIVDNCKFVKIASIGSQLWIIS
jgi:hypothetical protein